MSKLTDKDLIAGIYMHGIHSTTTTADLFEISASEAGMVEILHTVITRGNVAIP